MCTPTRGFLLPLLVAGLLLTSCGGSDGGSDALDVSNSPNSSVTTPTPAASTTATPSVSSATTSHDGGDDSTAAPVDDVANAWIDDELSRLGADGGLHGPVAYWRLYDPDDFLCCEEAAYGGLLVRDGSCLYVATDASGADRQPLLWPHGTLWIDESQTVLLPDRSKTQVGQPMHLAGGEHDLTALGRFTTSADVIDHLSACLAGESAAIAVIQM